MASASACNSAAGTSDAAGISTTGSPKRLPCPTSAARFAAADLARAISQAASAPPGGGLRVAPREGARFVRSFIKALKSNSAKRALSSSIWGSQTVRSSSRNGNGHVETDRGQCLGKAQFVAPFGDLLALLALDLRDVVEDILHRSPLLHEFAGALLADSRHTRDIVRSVAPQCEDVAHKAGVVDAVLPADRIAVHDLDAPFGALLLVNLAIVTYQLAVVLVGGDHEDLVTGFDAFCDRVPITSSAS